MTYEEFIQRYTFNTETDHLGEGGFGEVFKAYDNYLDKWVAIKQSKVKKGLENFTLQKEVELAKKLPVHPNIAHNEDCHRFHIPMAGTYDFGILQYYPEGNLSRLRKAGKINEQNLNGILTGILNGLEHLHKHKIIHRDIKPGNILIVKRGNEYIPKITDFGISKQGTNTQASAVSNSLAGGTYSYAAPEQLKGESKIHPNADLWSFGVILYELLTNKMPFEATTMDKSSEAARNEVTGLILKGTIPADIQSIKLPYKRMIEMCLKVDYMQRAQKADDLLGILNEDRTTPGQCPINPQASIPQPPEIQSETTKIEPTPKSVETHTEPSDLKPSNPTLPPPQPTKRKILWYVLPIILLAIIPVSFFFLGKEKKEISINTTPQGAVLSIDDQHFGSTPWTGNLAYGTHEVILRNGDNVLHEQIEINEQSKAGYNFNLQSKKITINTTPNGVLLSINGQPYESTPWTGKLDYGTYDLVLKNGDNVLREQIEINELSEAEYNLNLQNKEITINTTPQGALLSIDGHDYGRTPWSGNLAYGTHALVLKNGNKVLHEKITITENSKSRYSYDVIIGKEITINSSPSGATLSIDGQNHGTTPWKGTLAFGSHDIKLVNGKKTVNEQIAISQNGKSSFSYDVKEFGNFTETVNSVPFTMVAVKGGCFQMGSNNGDDDEKPVHEVCLDDYYIGQTEVTQALWKAVMNNNPSSFKGDKHPVEKVSWNDAQEFIKKLNRMTGKNFRLPTEAEWEYAARAGTTTPFNTGNCLSTSQANYDGNYPYEGCSKGTYRKKTTDVASFTPNAWGLYDMHGNVWEWCQDWYNKGYYQNSPRNNPRGTSSGSYRVYRGGSWIRNAISCRSACRNNSTPVIRNSGVGFRLASPK